MRWRLVAAAVGIVLLAACGSAKTSTTGTTTAGSSSSTPYGSPGVASVADRTVDITVISPLMFSPASITVSPGETVTFKVTNMTSGIHEFVLGDPAEQSAYETEMKSMGTSAMVMPDRSNILNEEAGVTKELTWKFPMTLGATVIYGSHEPGDYAGGLRGLVTVGTVSGSTSTTSMSGMTGMTSTTESMSGMTGMTSTTESMSGMTGMTTTTTGSGM